jgi:DNA-binding response OmpR family regulator
MNIHFEAICEAGSASVKCASRGRILVADDEELLRECVSAALTHHGFIVDAAEDGGAAWEALQIGRYDALITDNIMPALTGIDLVKKMRSAGMTLPVIMASGNLQEMASNPWLQSVSTLAKPFNTGQLLEKVNHVLREWRPASSAGLDPDREWREGF